MLQTSEPGAEEFYITERGDREFWTQVVIFERKAVESYVRAECGTWGWDTEEDIEVWRNETRPLEEIPESILAGWLTGWTEGGGAPGHPFCKEGFARVSRFRVLVTRFGGLNI